MKILIVEDDESTVDLIRHFLKDSGFKVITCKRGDEAFQMVIDERPDLAIIDGLIPGIHGFELCKKIKKDPELKKRPKVIVMSSVYKGPKYKDEVMQDFSADDFIVKPFKKNELLSKINDLLK